MISSTRLVLVCQLFAACALAAQSRACASVAPSRKVCEADRICSPAALFAGRDEFSAREVAGLSEDDKISSVLSFCDNGFAVRIFCHTSGGLLIR